MSRQRYSFDHVLAVVVVEFLFDTRCRWQHPGGAGLRWSHPVPIGAKSLGKLGADFVLFGGLHLWN